MIWSNLDDLEVKKSSVIENLIEKKTIKIVKKDDSTEILKVKR